MAGATRFHVAQDIIQRIIAFSRAPPSFGRLFRNVSALSAIEDFLRGGSRYSPAVWQHRYTTRCLGNLSARLAICDVHLATGRGIANTQAHLDLCTGSATHSALRHHRSSIYLRQTPLYRVCCTFYRGTPSCQGLRTRGSRCETNLIYPKFINTLTGYTKHQTYCHKILIFPL